MGERLDAVIDAIIRKCWIERSCLERLLLVLHVLCFITYGYKILSKTDFCDAEEDGSFLSENICYTPGCVHAASRTLDLIDPSKEPCEDFHKFSCGRFLKTTIVPDDLLIVNSFSHLQEKHMEQMRIIIENENQTSKTRPFLNLKISYQNCMNKTTIEEAGLKPALEIFKKLGGWTVLEAGDWQEDKFDWKQTMYTLKKEGLPINYLFTLDVDIDPNNHTKKILSIDQPTFGHPQMDLIRGIQDLDVKPYFDYMIDVAKVMGAHKSIAEAELTQALLFEIHLARISLSPYERRKTKDSLMTIKELHENYPNIPWKEYFNKMMEPSVEVEDDELILVHAPSYFKEFNALLSETEKYVLANYIIWRTANDMVEYLNNDLLILRQKYTSETVGITDVMARWKECVHFSFNNLGLSIGALHVRNFFDEEAKKNAVEMVLDIQREFIKTLKKDDWMDEKMKKSSSEKAESMKIRVAYPDELLDDNKLEEHYQNLEITPGHYLQTFLNLTRFNRDFVFDVFRKPSNESDWRFHVDTAIINAGYVKEDNIVMMTAGMLQEDYFSKDRPRAMNYGSIGTYIAYEIARGFNEKDDTFDGEEMMFDWWEPEIRNRYLSRDKCLKNQYGNDTKDEVEIKAIDKSSENFVFGGGYKEAYLAYQEWVKRNGPELELPGLKYTPSQLFWISAAQRFCIKATPELNRRKDYSPPEFREMGPFANSYEFAKDFNCPVGSKMNPKKKCFIL